MELTRLSGIPTLPHMVTENMYCANSSASKEDLAHLKAVVDAHCPVLDLFSNATPVEIAFAGHA